jgi:hypothetical protein
LTNQASDDGVEPDAEHFAGDDFRPKADMEAVAKDIEEVCTFPSVIELP